MLTHQKLKGDNHFTERFVDFRFYQEVSVVAEDAYVLERRVLLFEGEDLSFVGGDGNGASVGSDGDEHIEQIELLELLVHFVELVDFEVGVFALYPVVIVLHFSEILNNDLSLCLKYEPAPYLANLLEFVVNWDNSDIKLLVMKAMMKLAGAAKFFQRVEKKK